MSKLAQLDHNLTNHPPTSDEVIGHMEHIRSVAKGFGYAIMASVPESREQSLALTKLEEAVMWAIAGVARNQPPQPDIEGQGVLV